MAPAERCHRMVRARCRCGDQSSAPWTLSIRVSRYESRTLRPTSKHCRPIEREEPLKRPSIHVEPRGGVAIARHYTKDLVYGATDGIITTFAVVAGVAGGSLSHSAV